MRSSVDMSASMLLDPFSQDIYQYITSSFHAFICFITDEIEYPCSHPNRHNIDISN